MAEMAIFSFRSVHGGASGTSTRSSNDAITGNIRILVGFMLFLDSVSFLGLPACPCKGVGYGGPQFKRCIPGNIRILGRIMPFLASVRFRGLPVCPFRGV